MSKDVNLDAVECWNCDLTFEYDIRFTISGYDYDYDGNIVYFETTNCPHCGVMVRAE